MNLFLNRIKIEWEDELNKNGENNNSKNEEVNEIFKYIKILSIILSIKN